MNFLKQHKLIFVICPVIILFSSCFGINMDITLNPNGSGTVSLEYLVSRSLDSLGKLDGNERWNTIPLGKADFDRTLARLPDLKLLSFSSKEDEKNLKVNAKLEFKNIDGLMAFLDAGGRRSLFSGDADQGRLYFNLAGSSATAGQDLSAPGLTSSTSALNDLLKNIAGSYYVKISVNLSKEGNLKITNNRGFPIAPLPGSEIKSSGKKLSCSIPLYEVLAADSGINLEFLW